MDRQTKGIAGIGKLGSALAAQLGKLGVSTGFYHPDKIKLTAFHAAYPLAQPLELHDLSNLDFLVLALPAHQIVPLIDQLAKSNISLTKPVLVNMATSCLTGELRQRYPQLKWMPMKFMGHAAHLQEQGNGLFVTEKLLLDQPPFQEVVRFFSLLGQVVPDREEVVEQVNKLAAYYILKAAKELEKKMTGEGFPAIYQERALTAIAPTLFKSYAAGKLGHFAQQIADELEQELSSSR